MGQVPRYAAPTARAPAPAAPAAPARAALPQPGPGAPRRPRARQPDADLAAPRLLLVNVLLLSLVMADCLLNYFEITGLIFSIRIGYGVMISSFELFEYEPIRMIHLHSPIAGCCILEGERAHPCGQVTFTLLPTMKS